MASENTTELNERLALLIAEHHQAIYIETDSLGYAVLQYMEDAGEQAAIDPAGDLQDFHDYVLIADHARLGAIVAKLTEALKQHHDWHQKQNETYCDETSYTKAEAYSCSGLCDTTIAALAASSEGGSGDVQKH